MCVTTTTKRAKKTGRDIVCYKIVIMRKYRNKIHFLSAIMDNFRYEFDTEYIEHKFKHELPRKETDYGFYSYADLEYAKRELELYKHVFTSGGHTLVRCIIPKGTAYYNSNYKFSMVYCSKHIRIDAYLKDGKEDIWITKETESQK